MGLAASGAVGARCTARLLWATVAADECILDRVLGACVEHVVYVTLLQNSSSTGQRCNQNGAAVRAACLEASNLTITEVAVTGVRAAADRLPVARLFYPIGVTD